MSALLLDRLCTHEELRTRIETTVAHFSQQAGELTAEAIIAEIQADADELAMLAFAAGLCAALGPTLGAVAFDDLTNNLGMTDAEIAEKYGLERSTVSKLLIRVRRNLGLPVRQPTKARHRHPEPAAPSP